LKTQIISIVDDDVAIGESIAELLLTVGLRTHVFTSADQFLASDRVRATSCLIADIKMPGIGGIELQRLLSAKGVNLPVIFISAFEDAAIRSAAEKVGAVGFLNKPFSEDDLFRCIRIALPGNSGSA
jgi:FixJ family two-component response regulator